MKLNHTEKASQISPDISMLAGSIKIKRLPGLNSKSAKRSKLKCGDNYGYITFEHDSNPDNNPGLYRNNEFNKWDFYNSFGGNC